MTPTTNQRVGAVMAQFRHSAKLTQHRLGDLADISRQCLGRIERGETRLRWETEGDSA